MVLDRLKGGLIVSCQPVPDGPFDHPEMTAAFALAALAGGAVGLRIEGIANLKAVRRVTSVPIIGLIKADLPDYPIRITPKSEHAKALIAEGADIVAFDATNRARPDTVEALAQVILDADLIAMADCAQERDGLEAQRAGCKVLGTTLSGYTGVDVPEGPDLALVGAFAGMGSFTIAEGRYNQPSLAGLAMQHGADAVVVGSAITRPEHVTSWFAQAIGAAGP